MALLKLVAHPDSLQLSVAHEKQDWVPRAACPHYISNPTKPLWSTTRQWTAVATFGLCVTCKQLCGPSCNNCSVQVEGGIMAQTRPASPPWTSKIGLDGWLQTPQAGSGGGLELESAYRFLEGLWSSFLGHRILASLSKGHGKQRDSSLNTLVKDGGKMEGICFCPCLLPVVEAGRGPVLRHLEITILRKTDLFYCR